MTHDAFGVFLSIFKISAKKGKKWSFFAKKKHPKYGKTQKSPTSGSQVAPLKQI
ncbi:MAG: hypothetical protein GY775_03345 [Candidatus Scalindua sp.]|nr:hypothetical protein [Candidatus Scalindua sp.]